MTDHQRQRGVGRHTLDAAHGLCTETCTHPDHDGPVIVAIPADLKPLLDEWLAALDLTANFLPAELDAFGGLRTYAVHVPEGHPSRAASPIAGRLRIAPPPRVKGPRR